MKKLVYSAFALSLTTVSGFASENEWSQLDQEVEALASSLAQDDGLSFGGWIRARHDYSDDVSVPFASIENDGSPDVGTNDLSGFSVPDVRLLAMGSRGDYGYMVQYDFQTSGSNAGFFDNDGGGLLDAYVTFPIGPVTGTVGQFKPPIARSSLLTSKDIFFVNKTLTGIAWTSRDQGAMVSGDFDALSWWLAIQDGSDGDGDDYFFAGRVAFDFLGDGVGNVEGAWGGSDDPAATASASYWDDTASDDGEGFNLGVVASTSVYSFSGEVTDYGKSGYTSTFGRTGDTSDTNGFGDTTPFAVAGTYMLTPDTWEVGVRYQDFDDEENTDVIEVAVNHYMEGHDLKWTIQYSTSNSDDSDLEIDLITLGLTAGF